MNQDQDKNLGHKSHNTPSPHPHGLFVKLPQILTPSTTISLPHRYILEHMTLKTN
jgi:hypothetical protein